ncbi:MAG: hypothetical protein M1455_10075 [Actinobacteria bacterium]|nr:hypothetical protein [Actinomycetota bacterium]
MNVQLRWKAFSTFAVLIVIFFFIASLYNGRSQSVVIDVGAQKALSFPDEGRTFLEDCARTVCVAAKAADMQAQADAQRREQEEAEARAQAEAVAASIQSQTYAHASVAARSYESASSSPPPTTTQHLCPMGYPDC